MIIVGGGGHSKVIIDIAEKCHIVIRGIIDSVQPIGSFVLGYEVIGNDFSMIGNSDIVIAIGDNWLRAEVFKSLPPSGTYPTLIHPSAQIASSAKIGRGSVIMPGAIVNSDARVGDFCILNTNSSLDHDSKMGDFSSLAPNCSVGGNVEIGSYSAVCIGANISNGIKVGAMTVVGAGSTVLSDLPDLVVAFGTPACPHRSRRPEEGYL